MMKRVWWFALLVLCTGFVGCGGGDESAKDKEAADKATANEGDPQNVENGGSTPTGLDMKYVLPDYDVAIVVHPQRAWASKVAGRVEGKDVFPELFAEESGLDARKVERLLVLTKVPTSEQIQPRFEEEFDPEFDKSPVPEAGEDAEESGEESSGLGRGLDRDVVPASFQPGDIADVEEEAAEERESSEEFEAEGVAPRPRPDPPVMVVWFSEPFDPKKFLEESPLDPENPEEHSGVTYYQGKWDPERQPAVAFPNQKLMFLGRPSELKRLIDAKAPEKSPLGDRLAEQSLDTDVLVVAELGQHAEVVEAVSQQATATMPPAAAGLAKHATDVETVILRADLSSENLLDVEVVAKDREAATGIETSTKEGLTALTQLVEGFKALAGSDPEASRMLGIAESLLKGTTVGRDGVTVQTNVAAPADWSPIVEVVNKAVAEAEKAAAQAKRRSGPRQIGLAMHNFHDTYNGFPAIAAFRDTEGEPLLSWRVAILPFLGEGELFDQFKKDEPWDSEHNKALLAKMPDVFATPGNTKPGTTTLVAVVGRGTGLGDLAAPPEAKAGIQTGVGIQDITDGTAGTILLLETTADAAVPWTKPVDVAFEEETFAKLLDGFGDDGLMVLLADGYVAFLDPAIPPETFRKLLLRNDGEFPEWFEYEK